MFRAIQAPIYGWLTALGEFGLMALQTMRWSVRRPFRMGRLLTEIERIGVDSLGIILLVGIFTGMVFALQTGYSFRKFNAETLVGATVAISLARELAPVFTALMLISRSGSAMAAEIGTMAVSEQIDALSVMAVSPVHYLVVPRLLASALVFPLLTGLFNLIGILGAYIVSIYLLHIPEGPFMHHIYDNLEASDLWGGLFKALVFGILVSLLCCYQGLKAQRGAAGVGLATTRAVVYASVCTLTVDYFLSSWVIELF